MDFGPSDMTTRVIASPQGWVRGRHVLELSTSGHSGKELAHPAQSFLCPFGIFMPICSWPRDKLRTPSRGTRRSRGPNTVMSAPGSTLLRVQQKHGCPALLLLPWTVTSHSEDPSFSGLFEKCEDLFTIGSIPLPL